LTQNRRLFQAIREALQRSSAPPSKRYVSNMKFNHSSQILLEKNDKNGLSIMIDDLNFIDDYLTETCYLTFSHREIGGDKFKFHFILENYEFEEIKHALSKIDLDEIGKVYNFNNKL